MSSSSLLWAIFYIERFYKLTFFIFPVIDEKNEFGQAKCPECGSYHFYKVYDKFQNSYYAMCSGCLEEFR